MPLNHDRLADQFRAQLKTRAASTGTGLVFGAAGFGTVFGTVKHRSFQVTKANSGEQANREKIPKTLVAKEKTRTVANGTGLVFGALIRL